MQNCKNNLQIASVTRALPSFGANIRRRASLFLGYAWALALAVLVSVPAARAGETDPVTDAIDGIASDLTTKAGLVFLAALGVAAVIYGGKLLWRFFKGVK